MTETLSPAIPEDIDALAAEVLRMACRRHLALVTAESCTGGLLASLLTDVEGASHAFECGFVTYSARSKSEMLGVAVAKIRRSGAVSRPVAEAMAKGALAKSEGDIALAITGFAGEAGPKDEPGLVHFVCAVRGAGTYHCEKRFGDIGRGPVRIATLRVALQMLHQAIVSACMP
ncbi:CinA family protein [Sphingomonas sp.]|uniref:CinA family protein n=1 Tax=Sphingomonas sp. TaxID=28214 RepID=UPI003D6D0A3B